MPFDRTKYPANWKEFSLEIRNGRAGGKCEECGVENGWWKYTYRDEIYLAAPDDRPTKEECEAWFIGGDYRETKIVLTVAHLDNEGGICDCKARTGMKCTIADHVKALCQKCHLALDMPKHIANRRETIATRNDAARPLLGEI